MNPLAELVAAILAWMYALWPSYGAAIILLTVLVMAATTPLTVKATRSMVAMQEVQPELGRIQERYRDDRDRLNEELLAFYREHDLNPVSGCLPLLVQIPVFFVLYRVLVGLTLPAPDTGIQFGWTGAQLHTGTTSTQAPARVLETGFEPAYLDPSTELYQSLDGSFTMPFLGLDLASSASQVLAGGPGDAVPYLVLVLGVLLTGVFQQVQVERLGREPQPPQQRWIARVLLLAVPVICVGLPAGIVIYFLASNLWRLGVQAATGRWRGSLPVD